MALKRENDIDQDNHYKLDELRKNKKKNEEELEYQKTKED